MGENMITYDKLWETLKTKGLKKQDLFDKYDFSKGLMDNLKHNRSITMVTLNDICTKLDINPEDVITFYNDKK